MHSSYDDHNFCNICFIPASNLFKRNETRHVLPKSIIFKNKSCYNLWELSPVQTHWLNAAHEHFVSFYRQLFLYQNFGNEELFWNTYYSSLNSNYSINRNKYVQDQWYPWKRLTAVDNNNSRDSNDSNNNNNRDDNDIINDINNEDVEIGNRDWLDNFYILSRIFILFSIVYFYSSPVRFLVVTILGFLIYLYHSGLLRVIPVGQNANNNANHNEEEQENRNRANLLPRHNQNQQVDAEIRQRHMHPVDGNQQEWPRILRFIYTFFSSFFTSLIPDQPNIA